MAHSRNRNYQGFKWSKGKERISNIFKSQQTPGPGNYRTYDDMGYYGSDIEKRNRIRLMIKRKKFKGKRLHSYK